MPFKAPLLTKLLTIIISFLPFLSFFSFAKVFYLRKKTKQFEDNQIMSIIIPCKNEEESIRKIVDDAKLKSNFHLS